MFVSNLLLRCGSLYAFFCIYIYFFITSTFPPDVSASLLFVALPRCCLFVYLFVCLLVHPFFCAWCRAATFHRAVTHRKNTSWVSTVWLQFCFSCCHFSFPFFVSLQVCMSSSAVFWSQRLFCLSDKPATVCFIWTLADQRCFFLLFSTKFSDSGCRGEEISPVVIKCGSFTNYFIYPDLSAV